jgi:hypothetical protein
LATAAYLTTRAVDDALDLLEDHLVALPDREPSHLPEGPSSLRASVDQDEDLPASAHEIL